MNRVISAIKKVTGWYVTSAIILTTTLVLFVVFNVLLGAFYSRGPEPGLLQRRLRRIGSYKNQLQGYREMARLNASGQLGPNFLWCADLPQNETECIYVDTHHYTARFSKRFAEAICQIAIDRRLLPLAR
jgi:hypothetical protein